MYISKIVEITMNFVSFVVSILDILLNTKAN
ncbi:hypothetical protein CLV98_10692 [Dyadobacter jejuensis]|uniref:Uncharacterized protein n=1 Tax=Dyadobacter jejuensis TaxID=1082580 RepID=A0A316AJ08_9BACT|nr:hypothetical protein CLV98_10692 [Dyadobacter jejuensis]